MAGLKAVLTADGSHHVDCMCVPCMHADMEATMRGNGQSPALVFAGLPAGNTGATPERTRYATPGTRSGNGIVRLVSAKQVKYMRYLLATRDTSKLVRLPGSEDIERMSLAGARDLIDRLLGCPELPAVAPKMASGEQIDYIRSLLRERESDAVRATLPRPEALTMGNASALIKALKTLPKRADRRPVPTPARTAVPAPSAVVAPVAAEVTEGMYRTPDGTIFKVQRAVHGSGHLYAKRLTAVTPYLKMPRGKEVTVTHEFAYASGAIRTLRASDRMTIEQAREFGALYGVCCVCSRTLTDEKSIEAAIGPICAGRI